MTSQVVLAGFLNHQQYVSSLGSYTLPEANIDLEPENGWLEDEHSLWDGPFSGAIC